ncbi:MAG: DUF3795 domain-containing protein [Bacteroidetes bacterium]|nr:DUF3795 domain-containing protein [Bacteroidota bacterium]
MKLNVELKVSLIAPCGMNCGLCYAFQRNKNKCAGCNSFSPAKPNHCRNCTIKKCVHLKNSGSKYCVDCEIYPCARLKSLDKRYRTKYGMSLIENLNAIKRDGIRKFTQNEKIKWKCYNCGNIICVHDELCPVCGIVKNKF